MAVKTLDDLLAEGVSGRGVLVRSDLNVPLDDDGNITDPGPDHRVGPDAEGAVRCRRQGRRHRAPRQARRTVPTRSSRSLRSRRRWASSSAVTSSWPATSSASDALARAEGLTDGDILLLENIRFDPRETSKDDNERLALAGQLVELVAAPTARRAPSSPTASAWCTASRPRCTTSPRCCRTTRARWWPPRSRCSSS